MSDETRDGGGVPTPGRGGRATEGGGPDAGGDGLHSAGVGRADNPPPPAGEDARRPESSGSDGAHRLWMAIAASCAAAAAVLLFTVGVNAAFVAAVLGAVAWFWDQRNSIRAKITEDEIEDDISEEGRDELEEFEDEGGRGEGGR